MMPIRPRPRWPNAIPSNIIGMSFNFVLRPAGTRAGFRALRRGCGHIPIPEAQQACVRSLSSFALHYVISRWRSYFTTSSKKERWSSSYIMIINELEIVIRVFVERPRRTAAGGGIGPVLKTPTGNLGAEAGLESFIVHDADSI